ncbi:polysaccharide biosynthesis protein GumK [Rhizobium sp. TRM95111]|uniref:GumK N-terminal domain-containing glycosyltransferase n=1 Tax=Rhizobium alarense TaxID=2846851 RepID=UPI001F42B4DF|nr:polysaccharide biosynthesis protein GumK [Rhizobium alarense]MCF3639663.1 polysaccharide biosynthesis protein GumK [Rhizobium alarense]
MNAAQREDGLARMNIVILTSHVLLPGFRKASVHFVAQCWARDGHRVHFTTVGHSALSFFSKRHRWTALRAQQGNRYLEEEPGLHAGAYLPLLHGFSSHNALLDRLGYMLFPFYARRVPAFMRQIVETADVVLIESGTPLAFFDAVKSINPEARMLYFCRDLLKTVGASAYLRDLERRRIARFDAVTVPSRRLGEQLPPGGNPIFIPQGIDGALFEAESASPYTTARRNAVVVGDMLFDQMAVAGMAEAAPEIDFHLFGIRWAGPLPANVLLHGEQSFELVARYIRHADFGLAPYRLTPEETYLAESSLKLLQYSYCLLPVILPDLIPEQRGNEVRYPMQGRRDWRAIVDRALAMPHDPAFRNGLLPWREVARRTLGAALAPAPQH